MGNWEVGHLNLGAGAVVRQDLVRIDDAIADGSLAENDAAQPGLRASVIRAAERVHLIGLVSDGGVHSSLEHLRALIALGAQLAVEDLVVHAFTDGRDTLPHAGAGYLAELDRMPGARVGSVVGRYWAMDRDRRWDRTAARLRHARARPRAPPCAERRAGGVATPTRAVRPTSSSSRRWSARRRGSAPSDSVIAFNFRPDRMRQITRALAEPASAEAGDAETGRQLRSFPGWTGRAGAAPIARYTTLTEYEEGWPYPVVFAPERPADDARGGARASRRVTAARGRDREVPARHILLQRRRGGSARRASGASSWPRHAMCRPTTTSRR